MSLPLSPSSDSSDIELDTDAPSSDPKTGVVLHTDAPSDPTTDVDTSATQANTIVSAKSFFLSMVVPCVRSFFCVRVFYGMIECLQLMSVRSPGQK